MRSCRRALDLFTAEGNLQGTGGTAADGAGMRLMVIILGIRSPMVIILVAMGGLSSWMANAYHAGIKQTILTEVYQQKGTCTRV